MTTNYCTHRCRSTKGDIVPHLILVLYPAPEINVWVAMGIRGPLTGVHNPLWDDRLFFITDDSGIASWHGPLLWRTWALTWLSETWLSPLPLAFLGSDSTIPWCSPYPLVSTPGRWPLACSCPGEPPSGGLPFPMLLIATWAVLTVLTTLGTLASASECPVSTIPWPPDSELTPTSGGGLSFYTISGALFPRASSP